MGAADPARVSGAFQIFVKVLNGRTVTIDATPNFSVAQLKELLKVSVRPMRYQEPARVL